MTYQAMAVRNVSAVDAQYLDPFQMLAHAIIVEAAKDYRRYRSDSWRQHEVERFFRSQWFSVLSALDPEWLLKWLKEEE